MDAVVREAENLMQEAFTPAEVAEGLNAAGYTLAHGQPWTEAAVRSRLFTRVLLYCWACGTPIRRSDSDIHHVVPRSQGGKDEQGNRVVLCKTCHHFLRLDPKRAFSWLWVKAMQDDIREGWPRLFLLRMYAVLCPKFQMTDPLDDGADADDLDMPLGL